jgi:hypothetical protein
VSTRGVSIYDQRNVSLSFDPARRVELESSALNVIRVVAIYRRANGEPWEFGLVRLTGRDDAGTEDQAILIESPDWPEWLILFVHENHPENLV